MLNETFREPSVYLKENLEMQERSPCQRKFLIYGAYKCTEFVNKLLYQFTRLQAFLRTPSACNVGSGISISSCP